MIVEIRGASVVSPALLRSLKMLTYSALAVRKATLERKRTDRTLNIFTI